VRALVVAADPAERAALARALASIGLHVELPADAEAARRHLAASIPELVVLDGQGSRAPLFEVYQALRENPGGRSIPVIFARFSEEGVAHDGADHYLPTDSDAAAVARLAREILGVGDAEGPAPEAGAAVAEPTPRAVEGAERGREGRVLQMVLLVLGILLLLIGAALVLLRRETLPLLIAPSAAVPASPAPASSPGPLFGMLPPVGGLSPSPSPTARVGDGALGPDRSAPVASRLRRVIPE
jgi:CheY-like chemotaxis protein